MSARATATTSSAMSGCARTRLADAPAGRLGLAVLRAPRRGRVGARVAAARRPRAAAATRPRSRRRRAPARRSSACWPRMALACLAAE